MNNNNHSVVNRWIKFYTIFRQGVAAASLSKTVTTWQRRIGLDYMCVSINTVSSVYAQPEYPLRHLESSHHQPLEVYGLTTAKEEEGVCVFREIPTPKYYYSSYRDREWMREGRVGGILAAAIRPASGNQCSREVRGRG